MEILAMAMLTLKSSIIEFCHTVSIVSLPTPLLKEEIGLLIVGYKGKDIKKSIKWGWTPKKKRRGGSRKKRGAEKALSKILNKRLCMQKNYE